MNERARKSFLKQLNEVVVVSEAIQHDASMFVEETWNDPTECADLVICGPAASGKTRLATLLSIWCHPNVLILDEADTSLGKILDNMPSKFLSRPKVLVSRDHKTPLVERFLSLRADKDVYFFDMKPVSGRFLTPNLFTAIDSSFYAAVMRVDWLEPITKGAEG